MIEKISSFSLWFFIINGKNFTRNYFTYISGTILGVVDKIIKEKINEPSG